MRKKELHIKISVFILFIIISIEYSCAPAYIPNVANVPLLTNKGESQIGLYAGFSGLDIQYTTAPANHFGIMINSSFMNSTNDPQKNYHKHIFAEGGIGYFNKTKGNLSYELFSGYAYGIVDVSTVFLGTTYLTKATISRYFIQPDIGFSSKLFEISFTPRTVFVNSVSDIDNAQKANLFFVEPILTMNLGYKKAYLQFQAGTSLSLDNNIPEWFTSEPIIFSMGLHFKFGRVINVEPRYF